MDRIRVLIVDDSVVACRALSDAVASDPALEVAGTALSGRLALQKLSQCTPDVVTLDIEMPEMDGLQALAAIKKAHPRLPVIICSGLAGRASGHTMRALLGGASDYVTKPKRVAAGDAAMDTFRRELIGKIKAHAPRGPRTTDSAPPASGEAHRPRLGIIDAVVIGISTGGPKALAEVLPALPADLAVPMLIVQHMPTDFTRQFADSLARRCLLRVEEGRTGARPLPGGVWIAPGGSHMKVVRKAGSACLELTDDPPVNSCRPSADILFQSAAGAYGARLLAVVMTGMGQDGLAGARAVRAAGGSVYVQDEATSVVWGMPGAVAGAGLADRILALADLPAAIVAAARKGRGRTAEGAA